MVFDDITLLACNVDLARSKTLPTRKSTVLNLSEIDFTKPPPEWITTAVLHTSYAGRVSTTESAAQETTQLTTQQTAANYHLPTNQVIDFVTFSEFCAMKDTTSISLSALPSQPGFLRDTLFKQITTSLSTIVDRAERGLQIGWNTSNLSVPLYFPDAIVFVAESCNKLSKTLSAEPIRPGDVSEIARIYGQIAKIAVHTATVLDALELRNLVSPMMRLNCLKSLTRTLDRLISAATSVPLDVENTLEAITAILDANVPGSLLKCRFTVYHAMTDYLLNVSCQHLVNESVPLTWSLDNWTNDKLEGYIAFMKKISKQLDRIGFGDIRIVKSPQRENTLKINDLKVDMLRKFSEAVAHQDSKMKFESLRLANELAKLAGEPKVEAETLFCIANLIISKGTSDDATTATANSVLLAARSLNQSPRFQTKVQVLLTRLRRRTMSTILEMAAEVNAQQNMLQFEDAVKMFVRVLLARYPSEGIDTRTVMDGDLVKGLLRVVRVFHPDKNRSADEEGRWLCEEITKVLSRRFMN